MRKTTRKVWKPDIKCGKIHLRNEVYFLLSDNIKRHRRKAGLTNRQLANALEVTVSSVEKWQDGTRTPRPAKLLLLSKVLGVSLDELMKGDKE